MLSERGYNPEITKETEPAEKTSLREIFSRAKTEIVDSVTAWLKGEDKDVIRFEQTVNKSKTLGQQAGEFYKNLIPQSRKKPEKEYAHRRQTSYFHNGMLEALQKLKKIQKKIPLEKFKSVKQDFFESLDAEHQTGVSEETKQLDDGETYVSQTVSMGYRQEQSSNIIREGVRNYLVKNFNQVQSQLVIRDTNTGMALDLNDLLPNDFVFAPADMVRLKQGYNLEKQGIDVIPIQSNLRTYEGSQKSEGDFQVYAGVNLVAYGNLVKKGGILSLLHEISHAWQGAYYKDNNRNAFETFYQEVSTQLSVLADFKKMRDNGELDRRAYEEAVLQRVKEILAALDVEFDEENFIYENQPLKKGEVKIAGAIEAVPELMGEQKFIVKSEKLNQLVANYVREERDAWAHAIRILRFLRHEGIDLEPQLKTRDGIKSVIDPALESYQEHQDKIIESMTKNVRFSKTTKSKP